MSPYHAMFVFFVDRNDNVQFNYLKETYPRRQVLFIYELRYFEALDLVHDLRELNGDLRALCRETT
jgi:hypothetical protein